MRIRQFSIAGLNAGTTTVHNREISRGCSRWVRAGLFRSAPKFQTLEVNISARVVTAAAQRRLASAVPASEPKPVAAPADRRPFEPLAVAALIQPALLRAPTGQRHANKQIEQAADMPSPSSHHFQRPPVSFDDHRTSPAAVSASHWIWHRGRSFRRKPRIFGICRLSSAHKQRDRRILETRRTSK
jgi:hypothetical protein